VLSHINSILDNPPLNEMNLGNDFNKSTSICCICLKSIEVWNTVIIKWNLGLFSNDLVIKQKNAISCLAKNCFMISHITCLAELFLEKSPNDLIPTSNEYPECGTVLRWGDLIKKMHNSQSKQPKPAAMTEITEAVTEIEINDRSTSSPIDKEVKFESENQYSNEPAKEKKRKKINNDDNVILVDDIDLYNTPIVSTEQISVTGSKSVRKKLKFTDLSEFV